MRLIAGRRRGLRLLAPEGRAVRPTSDRARGALFNILEHGKPAAEGLSLDGAVVVDAFAGTGALGLEALSRGAAGVTFLERSPDVVAVLQKNLAAFGKPATARVLQADATNPPPAREACTLAFLDPPYGEDLAVPALQALAARGWLRDGAICCVEIGSREPFDPPPGFEPFDDRRYGAARLVILIRRG